jgi:hypothetical protein
VTRLPRARRDDELDNLSLRWFAAEDDVSAGAIGLEQNQPQRVAVTISPARNSYSIFKAWGCPYCISRPKFLMTILQLHIDLENVRDEPVFHVIPQHGHVRHRDFFFVEVFFEPAQYVAHDLVRRAIGLRCGTVLLGHAPFFEGKVRVRVSDEKVQGRADCFQPLLFLDRLIELVVPADPFLMLCIHICKTGRHFGWIPFDSHISSFCEVI